MITLTTAQQALVDAETKLVSWLFEVNNQYINFDAGTGTFTAGNTLYGATSGASATIDRVVYETTTTGKLMLSGITGTFQDGEIIYEAAYGSELITNGDCSSDSFGKVVWTYDAVDDEYDCDGSQTAYEAVIYQNIGLVENSFYKIVYTVKNYSAGNVRSYIGSETASGDWIGADGTYTDIIQAIDNAYFNIQANPDFIGSTDDISVKQITNAALANGTVQGSTYYWSTKTWKDSVSQDEEIAYDSDKLYFDSDQITFGETGATGRQYTFKVMPESFNSLTLNLPLAQYKTYVPNELSFEVTNSGNTLTASDFEDSTVHLKLVLSDSSNSEIIREWKYVTEKALPYYQKIKFECKDFVAKQLEGDFPTTKMVNDIFDPGEDEVEEVNSDPFCSPEPFGTCYIPLKSIFDTSYTRGYLLGPSGCTYTITEITAPRSFGVTPIWTSAEANFNTATKTDRFTPSSDHMILYPYLIKMDNSNYSGIHDGGNGLAYLSESSKSWTVDELINLRVANDTDGSAAYVTDNSGTSVSGSLSGGTSNEWNDNDTYHIEASGIWKYNGTYQNALVKFSRSDRSSTTKPQNVIETFLEKIGVGTDFIDSGGTTTSFEVAGTSYASWGLEFNGAYYYKRKRAEVLAELLTSCHSTIDVGTQVKLRVLEKTSKKTITDANVLKGSFSYNWSTQEQNDSGYVAFQETGKPQDVFLKLLVAAKYTSDNPTSETIMIPFVQDSENVQKIGTLHYQRKLGKEATGNLTGKTNLLPIQPGDVITVNHANYGASFDAIVDRVIIERTGIVRLYYNKYKYSLDDWDDLAPTAVTLATNSQGTYWQPVISGPDSVTPNAGNIPHVVPGKLRIGATGDYVLIDPVTKSIKSSNYVSGFAGSGFHLDSDLLEVGNIACRGIFRTAVFQKDVVSAIGGNLLVRPADVLDVDMTALDACTIQIKGTESFSVSDILRIKDGDNDEWMMVTSAVSAPIYAIIRDKGELYSSNANPTWKKGAAVVNYGTTNAGGIFLSSSVTNAPYLTVFTHDGNPWSGVSDRLRIGNLNGCLDYTSATYGFAVFKDSDNYITVDPDLGIRISSGASNALTLKNGGSILVETGGNIILSSDVDDPAEIVFTGTNYISSMGNSSIDGSSLYLQPGNLASATTVVFYIGSAGFPFGSVNIFGSNSIILGASEGNAIKPYSDSWNTLGTGSRCWSNVYADAGITACSDKKWKINVKASPLGLDFINKLDFITWEWDRTKGKTRKNKFHGLLAQDVLSVLEEMGYTNADFAGINVEPTEDGKDENWGLVYEQFIAPIGRAVQEEDLKVEALGKTIQELSKEIEELKNG